MGSAPYPLIAYRDPVLGERVIRIDERVAQLRFDRMPPIRPVVRWPGCRHHEGGYWYSRSRAHVRCGSVFDEMALMVLDFEASLQSIAAEPFWFVWPADMSARTSVPSYFGRDRDGTATLIEVRPAALIDEDDDAAMHAATQVCAELGWCYRRIDTLGKPMLDNVAILARCRHPRYAPVDAVAAAITAAAAPAARLQDLVTRVTAAGAGAERSAVLSGVYHLLWQRRLQVRLDRPLTMSALVTV
ncbi:TnsA-like heteromeric transposase endonuclease subunit [Nocardia sp. CDC159]|uniref:TnsA-like heteromeric transposase endonuclease subunit n=1 Tax=Nocardia pulmonis TaxID=2951408 RepID=A0A9X2IUR5_9NOCA|nr:MULTISPECIES: TnsA-like heteromeric transposase endonuclease subunit [Nocardia]MCM6772418.1 TnsA-like heteromeric transposase endonuclease subunit [Nocardia pulmonis]MCM6784924.1 TnsA-like heteromeric transposase endonuclease subunit [Nocardia sp. CDC159]